MEGKYEYSLNKGFRILQLSPSPQSFMYCFSISMECQFLELLEVLEWSIAVTVLKFPSIMIFVEVHSKEKKIWKMDWSSSLGA